MSDPRSTPDYRPEIDGLRALAVTAVVLYHASLGVPGGFIGVDVFFVISGYLITGVIARGSAGRRMGDCILQFQLRRTRRLAPALMVTSLATIVVSYVFLSNGDRVHMAWTALSQLVFASNSYFLGQADYFGPGADSLALLHYWSLAVEEQFYLVYPAVLILLLRRGWRVATLWLSVALVGSFAASACLGEGSAAFNFYMLPTRAWELLIGAVVFLGAVPAIRSRIVAEVSGWAGVLLILLPAALYDERTRFPGLAALPPCIGTVALIHANSLCATSHGSILRWRPTVLLGKISYSLYLVHWPVLFLTFYASIERPGPWSRLGIVGVSILLAWVSWRFVESPTRQHRVLRTDRGLMSAFVVSILVVGGMSAVVIHRNDTEPPGRVPAVSMAALRSGKLSPIGAQPGVGGSDVILWGDSHAQVLAGEFDKALVVAHLSGFSATGFATIPLIGVWRKSTPDRSELLERNQRVMHLIEVHKPRIVVLVATWTPYLVGDAPGDGLEDEESPFTGLESSKKAFERALRATISGITAAGAAPWIVKSVPLQTESVPKLLRRAELQALDFDALGVTVAEHRERQAVAAAIIDRVAAESGARTLDPLDFLALPNGHTRVVLDGKSIYADNDHLSLDVGAPLLRPVVDRIVGSK